MDQMLLDSTEGLNAQEKLGKKKKVKPRRLYILVFKVLVITVTKDWNRAENTSAFNN